MNNLEKNPPWAVERAAWRAERPSQRTVEVKGGDPGGGQAMDTR